jgi:hypothetical protein
MFEEGTTVEAGQRSATDYSNIAIFISNFNAQRDRCKQRFRDGLASSRLALSLSLSLADKPGYVIRARLARLKLSS